MYNWKQVIVIVAREVVMLVRNCRDQLSMQILARAPLNLRVETHRLALQLKLVSSVEGVAVVAHHLHHHQFQQDGRRFSAAPPL